MFIVCLHVWPATFEAALPPEGDVNVDGDWQDDSSTLVKIEVGTRDL
jgi:hypothetical protein